MIKEVAVVGTLLLFIALFFVGLGSALFQLCIAFFLAYATLPLLKWLEKKGFSRSASTATVVATVGVGIILLLLIIIPPIVSEIQTAVAEAPQNFHILLEKLDSKLAEYDIQISYDRASITNYIQQLSKKVSVDMVQTSGEILKNSLLNIVTVIVALLNLFIFPVFFVLVLHDYEKILASIKGLIPVAWKPRVNYWISETDRILSGFIRGQLLVCTILSVLYSTALLIAGVKFAILIGCLTGFLSCIPYVGFSLGALLAVLSSLLSGDDYSPVVWTIVLYGIVQFLESFIITPTIVGDKVGLSPFEAILALIVFGNLFGFIGLFAAIPCGGVVKVIFKDLLAEYKKTHAYRD